MTRDEWHGNIETWLFTNVTPNHNKVTYCSASPWWHFFRWSYGKQNHLLFKTYKLIERQWHIAIVLWSFPTFLTWSSYCFWTWNRAIILLFQNPQTKWELEWFWYDIEANIKLSTAEIHEWAWTSVAHRNFGIHETIMGQVRATFLSFAHWNIRILFAVAWLGFIRQNHVLARSGIDHTFHSDHSRTDLHHSSLVSC